MYVECCRHLLRSLGWECQEATIWGLDGYVWQITANYRGQVVIGRGRTREEAWKASCWTVGRILREK